MLIFNEKLLILTYKKYPVVHCHLTIFYELIEHLFS